MILPRLWKNLERHPLSAEYPDLKGAGAERMLEGVKKHGIVNKRKITIREGKILDGFQLFQACVAANVKPEAQGLPKGMTAEEYVEIFNDTRRHETQEVAVARAIARRERVAQAKLAGKPNVQIAAEEGVNESTIRNDLKVLRSGGANVDPPNGQITDSQGRQQPATKPPRIVPQLQSLIDDRKISPKLVEKMEVLDRNQQGHVADLIRAGTNPLKAVSEALGLGREPGDEKPAKRKPPTRNGRPIFDWREFDKHYSQVMRLPENVARVHPAERECPEFEKATRLLNELAEIVAAWRKKLQK